jgi:hypothetical protein
MRWVGLVADMEKIEMHAEFWCYNLKETVHMEHQGTGGTIILKSISNN